MPCHVGPGEEAQRELGSAASEVRRARADAEIARATAARLNARVTELATSESDARQSAEEARRALERSEAIHARDMQALEARCSELLAALDEAQQRSGPRRSPSRGRSLSPSQGRGRLDSDAPGCSQIVGSEKHVEAIVAAREEQLKQVGRSCGLFSMNAAACLAMQDALMPCCDARCL